jgi:hypothetical protein
MTPARGLLHLLPTVPIILAHLVGFVVAIILWTRRKSQAAVLALAGFGILSLVDFAQLARAPLVSTILRRNMGVDAFLTVNTGLGCCCSVLDVIAIACLIVALWKAVTVDRPEEDVVAGEEVT